MRGGAVSARSGSDARSEEETERTERMEKRGIGGNEKDQIERVKFVVNCIQLARLFAG